MDIIYSYMKQRKTFGRQPLFSEVAPHMLDSILPDVQEQRRYILRNPVDRFTMAGHVQSEHTVNTKRIKIVDKGINHAEGGWPKEVNYIDEEATTRHRRRIERDDGYINAVLNTAGKFTHYVKQNNAIGMYEMFFDEMPSQNPVEKSSVLVKNIFGDKELNQPVASIDWTAEEEPKLVISYCSKKFPITGPVNSVNSCLIWGLENPNKPFFTFNPPSPCWKVGCSPFNSKIIVGGLEDGRVCLFDISRGELPVSISPAHLANKDPINSLIYLHTRLNTEFFSGSSDGLCTWWDIRNLQEPVEEMMMAFHLPPSLTPSLSNSHPISCLQYDKNFPTRFLCGTETGFVVNVNRRGKTLSEQMTNVCNVHTGPVKTVQRSPLCAKVFITCGDFTVHIWSDDITVAPIITGTQQRHPVNDVCWAPYRCSTYMTIMANGNFKIYDLLRKYKDPVISLPVSKHSLLCLACHNSGQLVAIGDGSGATYLVALSESLTYSGANDKSIMMQTVDREHHREHILENRIKEIRLKLKLEEEGIVDSGTDETEQDEEERCRLADEEYKKIVSQELKLMDGQDYRNKLISTGRKR